MGRRERDGRVVKERRGMGGVEVSEGGRDGRVVREKGEVSYGWGRER